MKRTLSVLFALFPLYIVSNSVASLFRESQTEIEYRAKNKERIDALLRGESVPRDSLPPVSPAALANQLRYPEDVVRKLREVEYILPKQ